MSSPHPTIDIITPEQAGTLPGLLGERLRRTPAAVAYRYFQHGAWRDLTWQALAAEVARRQAALVAEGLQPGDRVALMLGNGWHWVAFEQAALGLGLVVVPLYVNDRPDNVAFILEETGSRLLLMDDSEQWRQLAPALAGLGRLQRVLLRQNGAAGEGPCRLLSDWLPADGDHELQLRVSNGEALATIVYTSGTVGRPKGVMLSHANILWNAHACHRCNAVYSDDLFLSFLPLSHTLERTVGYYLPMMAGATVAYNRAVSLLAEDLQHIRPTVLISVPRIYERIYDRIMEQLGQRPALAQGLFRAAVAVGWQGFLRRQGRGAWRPALLAWPLLKRLVADKVQARLGGRLRIAVCGGAPLSEAVAQLFIVRG
ncbi:MAG: AMP-binding protein [Gammaproteobacteria bacterium]